MLPFTPYSANSIAITKKINLYRGLFLLIRSKGILRGFDLRDAVKLLHKISLTTGTIQESSATVPKMAHGFLFDFLNHFYKEFCGVPFYHEIFGPFKFVLCYYQEIFAFPPEKWNGPKQRR